MKQISTYSKKEKAVFNWLMAGCLLIIAMVVIGGITRLTQSGLSMVKWEPIMGTLPPMSETEWNHAFDLYKESPEFKHYNSGFTLADFKSIFFWEYLHRLVARLIGLIFLLPCIFFWIRGYFSPKLKKQVLVVFAWGAFQGVLGWIMVKSGLVDMPHVSHYRLAAHLVTALGLMGYIFWIALSLKYEPVIIEDSVRIKWRKIILFFLIIVILQIIWGAFVAGLKAGYWYNTFPKMGEHWTPVELPYAIETKGITAFLESPGVVQFVHRIIAFTLLIISGIIAFRAFRSKLSQTLSTITKLLIGTVMLQFLLGVITVVYAVPVTVGVLHQFGAILILLVTLLFLFALRKERTV